MVFVLRLKKYLVFLDIDIKNPHSFRPVGVYDFGEMKIHKIFSWQNISEPITEITQPGRSVEEREISGADNLLVGSHDVPAIKEIIFQKFRAGISLGHALSTGVHKHQIVICVDY